MMQRANLVGGNEYKLCCYIDRVTKTDDGYYEIHDSKTSSQIPLQVFIQSNWQLSMYAMMLKQKYPYIKNIRLVWHFLKFNKEIWLTPSNADLMRIKKDIITLIDAIENAKKFSSKPSKLCNWCEFDTICKKALSPKDQ